MPSRKKNEIKKADLSRALITGAAGMVGSYIDFGVRLQRSQLDVTDRSAVERAVAQHKPNVIVHLAALTDLDFCEKNPRDAYFINTIGTYHVALAAKEIGATLLYVSTAGVFDGTKKGPYTEKDRPNPQNVYGHSKYLGECIVQELLKDYLIVRPCWMYGGGPKRDRKFVAKVIAQLNKPEIHAVNDMFGSPTFGKDLAKGIRTLIENNERGIIHMGGAGSASRFDVAQIIAETLKHSIKVTPVSADYFNLPAKRVVNEVMSSRLKLMPPWRDSLREYLEKEWKPFLTAETNALPSDDRGI